ncbi:MAG: hypothetical protein ACK5LS_00190 [Propioniciclava sp.]
MITTFQDFAASFPSYAQWLGVMLIAAIPFVESYAGSLIGVVIGLPAAVAIPAAVVGNIGSMLVFVLSAHRVRGSIIARKGGPGAESAKRKRLRATFDRYGVPGVSLLGQTMLPSQITSAALVSFGANRNAVIIWQIISITLWGIVIGGLTALGVSAL